MIQHSFGVSARVSVAAMSLVLCAGAAMAGEPGGSAAKTDLVPRAVLFGNPDRANVQLSPDGKHISYLAALDGVMNVWVAPVGNIAAAKAVTSEKQRPIRSYSWAFDNAHVLYIMDKGGDENWHVKAADIATGAWRTQLYEVRTDDQPNRNWFPIAEFLQRLGDGD